MKIGGDVTAVIAQSGARRSRGRAALIGAALHRHVSAPTSRLTATPPAPSSRTLPAKK